MAIAPGNLRLAAVLLAMAAVTAACNLQAPLYDAYAQAAGHGFGLRTLAFAAYVGGLLPVLLLAGGASDVLGRRPLLLAALATAALATILMLAVPTAQALFAARLLQGVAIALCLGSGAASVAELLPGEAGRSAALTALVTAGGLGGGALATGLLMRPGDLRPASFLAELALLALALAGMTLLPARRPAPGPARWLRPPCFPVGSLRFTLANCVAWTVTGLMVALLPQVLGGLGRPGWTGAALFLLCIAGPLLRLMPGLPRPDPPTALRLGCISALAAFGLFLAGANGGHAGLLLTAAATAGLSAYGFTYQAGLAVVNATAGDRRAAAVSGFLLCSYAGFGLPGILLGQAADHIGLVPALGAAWGLLAVAAGLVMAWPDPHALVPRPDRAGG